MTCSIGHLHAAGNVVNAHRGSFSGMPPAPASPGDSEQVRRHPAASQSPARAMQTPAGRHQRLLGHAHWATPRWLKRGRILNRPTSSTPSPRKSCPTPPSLSRHKRQVVAGEEHIASTLFEANILARGSKCGSSPRQATGTNSLSARAFSVSDRQDHACLETKQEVKWVEFADVWWKQGPGWCIPRVRTMESGKKNT